MNKDAFSKYIQAERDELTRYFDLRKLGVDIRLTEPPVNLAKFVFEIFWNDEQLDALEWWLYDAVGIHANPAKDCLWDENDDPIDVSTPEKIFDYILSLGSTV